MVPKPIKRASCQLYHRGLLFSFVSSSFTQEGPVKITLSEFKKCEGEATANNRKAKLIFLFEWEILIPYVGEFVFEGSKHIFGIEVGENYSKTSRICTFLTLFTFNCILPEVSLLTEFEKQAWKISAR